MTQDAKHLITKARAKMLLMQPFFGHLVMNLRMIETRENDNSLPTSATDGTSIWFNPKFVNKIYDMKAEYVNFLLAHEVMHVVMGHFTRVAHRDRKLWNFACDYVINAMLVEAGFALIPKALYDRRFDGMNAEQVYDILKKEEEKNPNCNSDKETLDVHPGDEGYPSEAEGGDGQSMTEEEAQAQAEREVAAAAKLAADKLASDIAAADLASAKAAAAKAAADQELNRKAAEAAELAKAVDAAAKEATRLAADNAATAAAKLAEDIAKAVDLAAAKAEATRKDTPPSGAARRHRPRRLCRTDWRTGAQAWAWRAASSAWPESERIRF